MNTVRDVVVAIASALIATVLLVGDVSHREAPVRTAFAETESAYQPLPTPTGASLPEQSSSVSARCMRYSVWSGIWTLTMPFKGIGFCGCQKSHC